MEKKSRIPANQCYLIDKKFCKVAQKRIATVMGKVAAIQDSGNETMEILNDLADIRNFFEWKQLREYSDKIRDSVDMKRFLNPEMPIGNG